MSKKHVFFLIGLGGISISPFLFDPLSQLIQNHGPAWATVKITRVHHLTFWCLSFIWTVYFGLWVWKSNWSWFSTGNLKRKFILVLAAGALFRLSVILLSNAPPVTDARVYEQLGVTLAQTGTYQDEGVVTGYRPIGYVAFLAALFKIFGHTLLLPQLANLVLDMLTLLLLWKLFSHWKEEKTALAACAIFAFYLPEAYSAQYLLTEPLFVFLWIFCICLWDTNPEKKATSFFSGLIFGLAALVRPVVLAWAIVPVMYEVHRRNWIRPVLFLLTAALVTMPWGCRNYKIFGVWALSTNSGLNFWLGANPKATGYYSPPESPPYDFKNQGEMERAARKLGWEYVKNHPLEYLRLGLIKEAMTFGFDYGYILFDLNKKPPYGRLVWGILGEAMWWIVLFFGTVKGTAFLLNPEKRRSIRSLLPFWTLTCWAAAHFFFFGVDRYHHPVVPFFAYLAVLPIWKRVDDKEKALPKGGENCRLKSD
ncbi:MAG: glycosyltransferase family 39 protein [candidate division Zixibacteria bacterium]|nr:glycosyltransferase family 39 protein [candidate division Zixibacteria bacterium]MCI0596659.1 glycosyltransferase family 39 protein [candidate division Zixibacteria bacterium]